VTRTVGPSDLSFFHRPRSIAIVGASEDPDKIGGRPLRYLREFGYEGEVYPVNARRPRVQGLAAYAGLDLLPSVPDVVLISVPGQAAADAVQRAGELGVRGCIVVASGFGETDDMEGQELQEMMVAAARASGMRLVGPNSQGLADFSSGAVLGFSTMFIEQPPADGPVGIVSQSGAMCSVTYGLLRRQDVGVRYADASGNDADVDVGELAEAVLSDSEVRLLLLYLEDLRDPLPLERAARRALHRGVPIVALMGGRSSDGQRAARSHTGALANEHRVVDAFFERLGIWRVRSVHELVASTSLYLQGWHPKGRKLTVVSNSGASCVLAADAAADHGLPLAVLAGETRARLEEALPRFASKTNPIDVTAALLSDSSLVGKVLSLLAGDAGTDACYFAMPVAGRGYDVERFALDAARFAQETKKPFVLSTPQPSVAAAYRAAGVVVFEEEAAAVGALAQYFDHSERMATAAHRTVGLGALRLANPSLERTGSSRTLNEADSLDFLERSGIPVVAHVLCDDPRSAGEAFDELGRVPVVLKGCTTSVTHKSEHGLVSLGLASRDEVEQAAATTLRQMEAGGMVIDGVLMAPMVAGVAEVILGAHVDPVFGPVVMVGVGGTYVEILADVQFLLPPFDVDDVRRAVSRLVFAPVFEGVRGRPPADVDAWAAAAVQLGEVMAIDGSPIESIDANPVILGPRTAGGGGRAVVVDAVVIVGRPG